MARNDARESPRTHRRVGEQGRCRSRRAATRANVIGAMQKDVMRIVFIIATIFAATTVSSPTSFAQLTPAGHEQHPMPGMGSPRSVTLALEIAQLRSRIAQIQATLVHPQGGSFKSGIQPIGMAMDDQMGMGSAAAKPAMNSQGMPTAPGCCSGMMGKMGGAGPVSTTLPSDLPGFPGASHIYHVGATGFFLDYGAAIKLTTHQQAALNGIKEKAIGDLAAAQRQIDQAEQELWMLTSADQPDAMKLQTKVRDIERLKGDQRIAFIRSVGEAARVLTDDQRGALLGTSAAQAAQTSAPQDSTGVMNSPGGVGPADPKGGMPGMGDDDSMGTTVDTAPKTKSPDSGMGDM